MNRTFLLRRVLLGVLIGIIVLALGFFGWVQFRTSEFHHREAQMLTDYHASYAACLRQHVSAPACAEQVRELCTHDQFWQRAQPPFVIDLAPQFNAPDQRCAETVRG